jgi:hypothetical protein
MPIGHNRKRTRGAGTGDAPGRGAGGRRHTWSTRAGLALLAVLALAAFLAPSGQAHAAHRRSSEASTEASTGASTNAAKRAERKERAAAKRQRRASRRAHVEAEAEASAPAAQAEPQVGGGLQTPMQETGRGKQNSSRERLHGDVHFSCTSVTWNYKAFPAGKNTVLEILRIEADKEDPEEIHGRATFEGANGEDTMAINAPGGAYAIDAFAKWKGNGLKGSWDIFGKIKCPARPELQVEKLQKLAGSEEKLTTSTIAGQVGDTVEYSIVVSNTGNVPLTIGTPSEPLGGLVDSHCDPGTLTGGTGGAPLAAGATTRYRCTHLLDSADEAAGSFTNTATVTGTPPEGAGPPITKPSNPVVVEVLPTPPIAMPALTIDKLQRIEGSGVEFTPSQLTGQVGQTVDYEIRVENAGDVPLDIEGFSDPQCDPGTIAGGVGGVALPVGASTTYTCKHELVSADEAAGKFTNTATVTAAPPPGQGAPFVQSSNTVVVILATAKSPEDSDTSHGSSGVLSSTTSQQPSSKSGVLGSGAASVPKLKGSPQGCARGGFRVSISSAQVASVTFYLDGHKLKTLTAKNAHKGLLSIGVDPATLKIGVHKLVAKITMDHTGSAKATTGTRTTRVLRCAPPKVTPKFTG